MSYNFTDRVRKVFALARQEAVRHRHDQLGPEHVLLGMLNARDPELLEAFAETGIRTEEVRDAVLEGMRPGQSEVNIQSLTYSYDLERVLELALSAARQRNTSGEGSGVGSRRRSQALGSLDLLAGLVGEERGSVALMLRKAGLTPAALGFPGGTSERVLPELGLVIDDASDRSIYEQIVEQIQERIALGDLRQGERLPAVRRLADSLDIAPGTVARAYAELERLGLVVTGGARGTWVAHRGESPVSDRQRSETLTGLLRPVAVAAFHLGGTADELRSALEGAMVDIFASSPNTGG